MVQVLALRLDIRMKLLVFLLLLLVGCECIPTLDTEKEISPSQYSKILCINCVPNLNGLQVVAGNVVLHKSLNYNFVDYYNYVDVHPGTANFVLSVGSAERDSVIFSGLANLQRGVCYSFLIYPMNKRVQSMILVDSIRNYLQTNSYFRFINLSPDSPYSLYFSLEDQYPITLGLGFRTYSQYFTTYPGTYRISVINSENDSVVARIPRYQFEQGKGYSIILRGYMNSKEKATAPDILVVSHNFDEIYKNLK